MPVSNVSFLFDPTAFSFAELASRRIESFKQSNSLFSLRAMVRLANDNLLGLQQGLQGLLASFVHPDFTWEELTPESAEQVKQTLSGFILRNQQVDQLKQNSWLMRWLNQFTGIDTYIALITEDIRLAKELLQLLEEDYADVMAAHKVLSANDTTLSLEEMIRELNSAA